MKAMTRPCRISPRSLLHTSSTCLNKSDSSTSLTKPSTQQQDLDFFQAADILFSEEDPKRKKKFGWDFHLWQAFVACLPSVAVYLTAQYARYDMRRMEAEREKEASEKQKIEEKQQEEEARKLPGFRTLHERLDKLEGKISEIESKTAQSAAALQEGKLEGKISEIESKTAQSAAALQEGKLATEREVEKVESNARVGTADTFMERKSDARSPENVAKDATMRKGEPVQHNVGPLRAPEVKSREGRSPDSQSKPELNEKGEADKKHQKDLQTSLDKEGAKA